MSTKSVNVSRLKGLRSLSFDFAKRGVKNSDAFPRSTDRGLSKRRLRNRASLAPSSRSECKISRHRHVNYERSGPVGAMALVDRTWHPYSRADGGAGGT